MTEKIKVKLYTYDHLSMRNKSHTYDIIGHMVWQPYWIEEKYLIMFSLEPLNNRHETSQL